MTKKKQHLICQDQKGNCIEIICSAAAVRNWDQRGESVSKLHFTTSFTIIYVR